MCPAGIKPAIFWFMGQYSNQLRHISQGENRPFFLSYLFQLLKSRLSLTSLPPPVHSSAYTTSSMEGMVPLLCALTLTIPSCAALSLHGIFACFLFLSLHLDSMLQTAGTLIVFPVHCPGQCLTNSILVELMID